MPRASSVSLGKYRRIGSASRRNARTDDTPPLHWRDTKEYHKTSHMLNHHTHPTYPIQDKNTIAFDTSMASPARQHTTMVHDVGIQTVDTTWFSGQYMYLCVLHCHKLYDSTWKYLTTVTDVMILNYAVGLDVARIGPNLIPRACDLVNCLLTVFLYLYSPSRLNSYST